MTLFQWIYTIFGFVMYEKNTHLKTSFKAESDSCTSLLNGWRACVRACVMARCFGISRNAWHSFGCAGECDDSVINSVFRLFSHGKKNETDVYTTFATFLKNHFIVLRQSDCEGSTECVRQMSSPSESRNTELFPDCFRELWYGSVCPAFCVCLIPLEGIRSIWPWRHHHTQAVCGSWYEKEKCCVENDRQ